MTQLVEKWQDFAQILIKTNELDPMYPVIKGLDQTHDREWMGKFILYFILFYDAGGAATAADAGDGVLDEAWFKYLQVKAFNPMTIRGGARRHFRGEKAISAIDRLSTFGLSPWEIIEDMYPFNGRILPTYSKLYNHITSKYVKTQMGPYFIWKLYDIFNVCLDMPLDLCWEEAIKFIPTEPRKAAIKYFGDFETGLSEIYKYIQQFDHPVRPGKCGLSEAETILCGMKVSYGNPNHGWIGFDIEHHRNSLKDYPELAKFLPPPITRGAYTVGEFK